jgi:dTDP-4-amino-4,6-dideoxygalactose transaminase
MRDTFLPFARPALGEEEIAEVVDTLRSGWITTGPKVERFTAAFAEYVEGRFAVPVSSATAGLHVALLALGVGPGDEVITTPLTFVATLNTIVQCGAVPVLADIDAATLNVRVEEISKRVTAKTKVIVPVHYVGQPADLDPILELAAGRGIAVLEDAAHAVGSEYKGRKIGSFPTTSVFSFHPNKNITTGEGGMVVTDDEAVFEKASLLKFHGMDREAWKRFAKSGSPRYDVALPGFKYNMMDIQAALGIHQLPRLPGFIAERARLAARYDRLLSGVAGLILPQRVAYPV